VRYLAFRKSETSLELQIRCIELDVSAFKQPLRLILVNNSRKRKRRRPVEEPKPPFEEEHADGVLDSSDESNKRRCYQLSAKEAAKELSIKLINYI